MKKYTILGHPSLHYDPVTKDFYECSSITIVADEKGGESFRRWIKKIQNEVARKHYFKDSQYVSTIWLEFSYYSI